MGWFRKAVVTEDSKLHALTTEMHSFPGLESTGVKLLVEAPKEKLSLTLSLPRGYRLSSLNLYTLHFDFFLHTHMSPVCLLLLDGHLSLDVGSTQMILDNLILGPMPYSSSLLISLKDVHQDPCACLKLYIVQNFIRF